VKSLLSPPEVQIAPAGWTASLVPSIENPWNAICYSYAAILQLEDIKCQAEEVQVALQRCSRARPRNSSPMIKTKNTQIVNSHLACWLLAMHCSGSGA
jgi:hypothetical protein